MAKVLGMKNLERKLLAIPKEIEKDVKIALVQAANEFADAARSAALDGHTGQLAKGITVLDVDEVKRGRKRDGAKRTNLRVAVKNKTFYALSVEKGHDLKNKRKGEVIGHVRAYPTFYPTWHAMKSRLRGKISRAATKAAKRVWFK